MSKIFKWNYKPSGCVPVQSEGWVLGYYFYFRARHDKATIEFYNNQKEWDELYVEPIDMMVLKRTKQHKAGYLNPKLCMFLIIKGCIIFLVKRFINTLK